MVSSAVPVGLKSVSDEAEVKSEKKHSVTKEEGLSKHKMICDIILYLMTNSLPYT